MFNVNYMATRSLNACPVCPQEFFAFEFLKTEIREAVMG